jgi:5-methylcytosine-specific restriction protein B
VTVFLDVVNFDSANSLIVNNPVTNLTKSNNMDNIAQLNQILFGPPGTGKTYNSINKSISIVNPEFNLEQERTLVKTEYERLEKEGKILFTTFHQSMSYEDFIEGIKPVSSLSNGSLNYEIQAGIFKIACSRASYLCFKKHNQSKGQADKNYTFDDLYFDFIESIRPDLENGKYPKYKTKTGKEVEIFDKMALETKCNYNVTGFDWNS